MMQHLPRRFKRTVADELPITDPASGSGGGTIRHIPQDLGDFPVDGSEADDGPYAAGDYLVFDGDPQDNGATNLEFVDSGPDFFTVWNEYANAAAITNSTSTGTIRNAGDGSDLDEIPGMTAWQFLRIGEAASGPFTSFDPNDWVGFQIAGEIGGGTAGSGGVLQRADFQLSKANILGLNATPLLLVLPPVTGLVTLSPVQFVFSLRQAGIPITTAGNFELWWGKAGDETHELIVSFDPSALLGTGAAYSKTVILPPSNTVWEDDDLYGIYLACSASLSGGTGSLPTMCVTSYYVAAISAV